MTPLAQSLRIRSIPSTWIPLTVARSGPVKLIVFNISGQMVRVLAGTELAPCARNAGGE